MKKFGLPRQTLRTGVPRRTSGPALSCEMLCGSGHQLQERSRRQDSSRAAQGAQVRASTTAFCGEDPLHDPWGHEGCEESNEPRWEHGIFLAMSDRSDELYAGTERGMHKVRTLICREATERVDLIFLNAVSAKPWDAPRVRKTCELCCLM